MSLMFKFSLERFFFESKDTGVFKDVRNKLFASNEKQIDNHVLMLDMLHSQCYTCQLCVPTIVEVSLKDLFGVDLLIFTTEKANKGAELQLLCTQGTLQGERVEDHRMMFTRHLHLLQSHVQAKLYICKTDNMLSLQIPTSVCIFSILFSIHFLSCWQGEVA